MDRTFGLFLGGLFVFVVASVAAEYVSRQVWPRAPGN